MKKYVIFIGVIIISIYGYSKELNIIKPELGYLPDLSIEGEKEYFKIRKIGKDVDSGLKEYKNLKESEKRLVEKYNEYNYNYDSNNIKKIYSMDYLEGDCLIVLTKNIITSSKLKSEKNTNYFGNNLLDNKYDTAWIEGKSDYGIGEYVDYCFEHKPYGINKITIYNGYIKNKETWEENSRVKKILVYLNNIPYVYLELKDSMRAQTFYLWNNSEDVNKIRFEIAEVYKGTKYKDTAITEIIIFQGGLCFPASTKISLSDNSAKKIDQVKSGDEIITYNSADNKFEKTKVISVAKVPHNNLVEINFGDRVITSTDDHPYLSENGWKSCNPNGTKNYKGYENIKELKTGDKIYFIGENGKTELKEVKVIKKVDKKEMCYTITKVENGDNFIADGAVVGVEERR